MDFVAYVEEMPTKGETVLAKSFELVSGGKGANQAFAAGRLGADVSMIGAVGNDEYGRTLIKNLNKANVDTKSIVVMDSVPTGRAHIAVNIAGNNSIIVIPGTNSMLTPVIIDENIQLLDDCSIVMLQLETPIETACYVARLARERGKIVILDPAPAVRNLPLELFQSVDIIKPNEHELETLTGMPANTMEEMQLAAQSLLKLGVKTVVVTAGKCGALLVTKDCCINYPVEDVKVVDTTAAGDSFIAALAYALSDGMDIESAIQTANDVSTIVVTRKGAQSSIPTMDEVRVLSKKWRTEKTDK